MPDSESRNSCLRGDDTRHDSELAPVKLQQTPQARRSEVPSRMTSDKPNRETFLDGLNTLSTSSSVAFGHPPAIPLPNNPPLRTEDDPESYDIVFAGNSNDPNSESQQHPQTPASAKRRVDSQGKPNAKRPNLTQLRSEALFTGAAAGAAQPLASTSSRLSVNIPESVPESPEVIAERKRKEERMRQIFRKCFEDTFDPRKVGTSTTVFAENSDPEDN